MARELIYSVWCTFPALGLVAVFSTMTGCGVEPAKKVWVPETATEISEPPKAVRPRRANPKQARTNIPAGNERTRLFLARTAQKHPDFCGVDLNEAGDIVKLDVHVCWPGSDEDLEMLSELESLEELWIGIERATDAGLVHLEKLPRLRKATLFEAYHISAEAIERLQLVKPMLELEVRFPTLSEMPARPPWQEAPHVPADLPL